MPNFNYLYMPTKKKRIGFIPREDVMSLISKMSFENNLSNSKVINILVEEALSKRGLLRLKKEKGKSINKISRNESTESKINSKEIYNYLSNRNLGITQNINNNELFDFETYEKFLLFLEFQEMMKSYEENL